MICHFPKELSSNFWKVTCVFTPIKKKRWYRYGLTSSATELQTDVFFFFYTSEQRQLCCWCIKAQLLHCAVLTAECTNTNNPSVLTDNIVFIFLWEKHRPVDAVTYFTSRSIMTEAQFCCGGLLTELHYVARTSYDSIYTVYTRLLCDPAGRVQFL